MNKNTSYKTYKIKDFLPLIIIFTVISGFTIIRQNIYGINLNNAMHDFMGSFFIVFGGFKLANWHGFAKAYATYDIIAKKSHVYAYLYPLLEVALGVAYLKHFQPFTTNLITFILMIISSIGVAQELYKKKPIMCACLGTVFKIPMTYVTLAEDLLMAGMALYMLLVS